MKSLEQIAADERALAMRRCQKCGSHDVWDRVRYLDADGELTTYPACVKEVESKICLTCKHIQGLGPAVDDERTAIELRAAELAAAWKHDGGVGDMATFAEHLGWSGWPHRQPQDDEERIGFHAAQILNHDGEQAGHRWTGEHMADYAIDSCGRPAPVGGDR